MKYQIAEIFYSIQGEGYFTGIPAIFIRFCGCNLQCRWCDEQLHRLPGNWMSEEEIWKSVEMFPSLHLVLTGGEPSLQPALDDLIKFLKSRKHFYVQMETNGTHSVPESVDWITVSPKTMDFITGQELKLVYQGQDLSLWYRDGFQVYYLQPCNFQKDINWDSVKQVIDMVKNNPQWRLRLQIHKLMQIP